MSTLPQTLKGFRDFLPQEAADRERAMQTMRSVFVRHGFVPLETPTLEYKATIMGKYGEEADKLVYSFTDHGGRDVALRYDQTVPTARVIAQYRQELPFPFRRYQIQNVFRADKPQKGRYREFTQADADIFGSTDPLADAEILSVFWRIYTTLGLTDIQILVNDRQSLFQLVNDSGIEQAKHFSVLQSLDKLDKQTKESVQRELLLKEIPEAAIVRLFNLLETAKPSDSLAQILAVAEELGVPKNALVFSPTLVRGLDYYTGLIFESKLPDGSGSLGGGGRYDSLIGQLSGADVPAVGFGIGFDRTVEVLQERGLAGQAAQSSSILVTIFDENTKALSAKLAAVLRERGINAELYPESNEKIGKQLKYANRSGKTFVALIGSDEAQSKTVTLKHLPSGTQYTQLPVEEAISILCLPIKDLPPAVS